MALLEVGRVIKPHGLKGELVVELVTNRLERLDVGSRLSGERAGSPPIELEVLSARPHQGRHLVYFEGINSREAAEAARGLVLKAEETIDPDAYFVHELIGAECFDQYGTSRGTVTSIEANPASDLLVLDSAHYVPMRFVVSRSPGRVEVEVPDGLFDA